ncbi:class I SAM-dependent methyltransferase [Parerythrobacter jejuensis]|uniref:Methyltransferase domain-containing protein n=1 Tax=Parerythrobacter jejuensis TaxID=795812 RepID=A0A845AU26_9SPHN|nr:methyltransferase domain-containing protein [Parerythrobacter jejuensis]MXP32663.1 methyltransferase domain-containing protein [Parerythrobacter jejuensis]
MTDKAAWQGRVGTTWATHWARTDRSFTGLTDRLLGRASARPIRQALDIGCGAGELSLALGRGHSMAEIIGVDVSDELIAVAKDRGSHLANVSFACGDAAEWSKPGFAPDLLVSRHGVMFFDDPVASFEHLASIADHDARLVFSCFRDSSENAWSERILSLLPAGLGDIPDPYAPGPFAFADPKRVEMILSRAGWIDISIEPVDYAFVAGAGDDAVEEAVKHFLLIGPAASAAAELDDEEKGRFVGRLRRFLANSADGSIVALRAGAWIVSARPGRR